MNLHDLKDLLQLIVENRELKYWGRAILLIELIHALAQFN